MAGACTSACSLDNDCASGYFCDASAHCAPQVALAGACNTTTHCKAGNCRECTSGTFCVDGLCCDGLCANGDPNDCIACNVAGNEGHCGSRPAASACSDGNACTVGDACTGATCVPGTQTICPVPDECHDQGICDTFSGLCSNPSKTDMTPCSSDMHDCTGDSCVAGVCTHPQFNGITCRAATCRDSITLLPASLCGAATGLDCPGSVAQDCSPGTCAAGACSFACTVDTDCAPTGYCNAGTCSSKAGNGGACATGAGNTCLSGYCVDGVCCDSQCSGQCQACDIASSKGQCTTVASGGPHGSRKACNGEGSTCGGTCDGSSPNGCKYPDSSLECRHVSCDPGTNTGTLAAGCDGAGECPPVQTQACAPYVCGPTQCAGDCPDGVCSSGNYCAAGVCVKKLDNGKACGKPEQCQSNFCVDGVCCDGACKEQCRACDLVGSLGTCTTVKDNGPPHGGRIHCEGSGPCTGACDGSKTDGCTFPGNDKLCAPPACENGVETPIAVCDGNGACGKATQRPCTPFACGITSCRTACASPSDCARTFDCVASMCVSSMPDQPEPSSDAGSDAVTAPLPSADASAPGEAAASADAGPSPEAAAEEAGSLEPAASQEGGCSCSSVGRGHEAMHWELWGLGGLCVAAFRKQRRGRRVGSRSISVSK